MKTLVVLPTYNEAENIEIVLDLIRQHTPAASVLVVDDGSPDGTADLAEKWGAEHGAVDVLRRSEKSGLGSAYRAGFAWGLEHQFEILIEMDSDLQHDPAMLPALIHAVEDGADLAIGSRYVPGGALPGWKWSRRFISQGGNIYAAMVLGLHVRDLTAGFRAYAVANNAGRIVEVPITFGKRQRGASKMSSMIVFEALGLVTWWGFRDRVLRRHQVRPTTRLAPGRAEAHYGDA